jgi:predicted nucleic acid-binding OB-fold protein
MLASNDTVRDDFMSGFSRDRNVKIPKKTEKKSTPKPSQYLPTRPAEGRRDVPKKVEQKPRTNQRPNNQRRQGQKHRGNRGRGNTSRDRPQRQRRPTPLDDEVWARVVENDSQTKVIVAFGESKMLLGRFTAKNTNCSAGDRIYVGVDAAKRTDVGDILGMAKMELLSNSAASDLPLIVQLFIEEKATHFIKAFFNIAGPLSLKQHAFELLPGIGKKKALQMVEVRGSGGFTSLEHLNESCAIDAAELLSKRFVAEISDRNLQPRLTELLLPVAA